MADNVADLAVRVGADVSPLISGLKKGESSLASFGKEVTDGTSNLKAYGAAVIAAGTAILAYLYKDTADAIDAQSKLAKGLDTSYASMSALAHAADLTGLSQEQTAAAVKKMSIAIGELSQGTGEAGKALESLGFKADELAAMSADERIEAINRAIADTVPAAEQAAVAADIFGAKVGMAVMQIDPDTLKRAREETQAFGVALTDVEATQIENANDAMTSAALVIKGALAQAAVLLAPIIEGISNALVAAGKETGGFKGAIKDAFEFLIEVAATAADVWSFFGETLKGVGDLIVSGFVATVTFAAKTVADSLAWILEKLSYIPGIDFSDAVASIRGFSDSANEIMQDSLEILNDTTPYYTNGDAIREWAANAITSSQEAAAAQVAARQSIVDNAAEAEESMTAKEKEQLQARLDALRESYMTEAELSANKMAEDLEALAVFRDAKLVQDEEYNALEAEIKQKHEDNLNSIEDKARQAREKIAKAEAANRKAILSGALSDLAGMMSSENKKMFEIGKTAAIAQSLINTYQGMSEALKLGYPMGLVAAAAIGVAGFANVASIKSQTFSGGGTSDTSSSDASSATSSASSAASSGGGSAAGGTLTVQGLSAGSLLTGDVVAELATELLDYQRNGGKVVLA